MSSDSLRTRPSARLVLRLAFRVLARAKARNALIAAMIALPVIAMTAFGTVYASTQPTPRESLGYELGRTQAWVETDGNGTHLKQSPTDPAVASATYADGEEQPPTDPSPYFPAGVRSIRIDSSQVTVKTASGIGSMSATVGQAWDPMLDGRYTVASGRVPSGPGEAMATASALTRMGIRVGQTATLTRPAATTYRIVGVLDDRHVASSFEELFVATAPPGTAEPLDYVGQTTWYLTGSSVSWSDVQRLNAVGAVVLSRSVVLNPPTVTDPDVARAAADRATGRFWSSALVLLVGVFGLLQVALLATAAFMVGARQQERTLAILASVGADRRVIRSVVSLGGVLLGAIGAATGVALGVFAGWILTIVTRDGSASQYPGFHVSVFITGAIVVLAIAFSWIAASIPARSASRLDVVSALRGATRPLAPRRRTPVIGIILVLGGCALCVLGGALVGIATGSNSPIVVVGTLAPAILGPIVILVGVIFIAPTILRWVSGLLALGGVGARLASRDAARNAARTVPAIAAVISSVFVAAFGVCIAASSQVSADRSHQYGSALNEVTVSLIDYDPTGQTTSLSNAAPAVSALQRTLPVRHIRVLSTVAPDGTKDADRVIAQPEIASRFLCPWDPRSPHSEAHQNEVVQGAPCDSLPQVTYGQSTSGYENKIMIGDAADLALILGTAPSARSVAALAAGKAVSLYPEFLDRAGKVRVDWWPAASDREYGDAKPLRTTTLDAVVQSPPHDLPYGIIISPETAARLTMRPAPTTVLASLTTPATTAQKDASRAAISALYGDEGASTPEFETGPDDVATMVTLILLTISAVVSLAASIAAIGLARSDGRRDDAILGAVGAPPMLRRSFGFWQAVVIAGVGSILGVLLGVIEFVSLTIPKLTGSTTGFDPAVPVLPLMAVAVCIPAVIAVGAWTATRRGRTSVLDRSVIA